MNNSDIRKIQDRFYAEAFAPSIDIDYYTSVISKLTEHTKRNSNDKDAAYLCVQCKLLRKEHLRLNDFDELEELFEVIEKFNIASS